MRVLYAMTYMLLLNDLDELPRGDSGDSKATLDAVRANIRQPHSRWSSMHVLRDWHGIFGPGHLRRNLRIAKHPSWDTVWCPQITGNSTGMEKMA